MPFAFTSRRAHVVSCALLVAATWAVYWAGRGGGFVFDDFPNIVDNVALRVTTLQWSEWLAAMFSSPASELQRPLAMFTFALNQYFTGANDVAMKLTNIGIHAVNGVLVYWLATLLVALPERPADAVRQRWAARFIAFAWTLHPLLFTSVLYVVQRMESLAHAFVFLGLALYIVGRQRQLADRNGWGFIASALVLCTALGTLSKESAALLPLYAFLLEACVLRFRTARPRTARRLLAMYGLLLVLPAIAGGTWLFLRALDPGAYAGRDFTLAERLLTEGRVLVDYLRWSVLPPLRELGLYHDDYIVSRGWFSPPATAIAWALLVALAAIALAVRRRLPLASLGLLWFLAAHALTATFLPLELVYEHRNYFAVLGVCLVLANLLVLAPPEGAPRRLGGLFAVAWVLGFAGLTTLRAQEWEDPHRLAASEAARHPQSPRATYGLGRTLTVMSGYRTDSPLLQPAFHALDHARQVPRSGVLPHSALLLLSEHVHRPADPRWWAEFEQRLRTDPVGPQEANAIGSLTQCAVRRECRFEHARMEALYEAANAQGRRSDVLTMQGDYALNVLGQRERALGLWREAVRRAPGVAQYRINLVKLLVAMDKHDEARREIATLRTMGALGQYESAADSLERRMGAGRDTPQPR